MIFKSHTSLSSSGGVQTFALSSIVVKMNTKQYLVLMLQLYY